MPTPRCRDRAAAWQTDMHRAAQYWYARATTPAEIEQVDAVLNATLVEGPDFARHHRGSTFRTPPQVCTDRNFLHRLMFIAETIERKTYATRKKGKHGGALGKNGLRLFKTLLYVVSKREGCLYPSRDTLAKLAQVSKPTIDKAMKALALMGLVTVYRRIKRIRTAFGIRVVQDSNCYEYHEPHGLGALAWSIFRPVSESKNMSARKLISRKIEEPAGKDPATRLPLSADDPLSVALARLGRCMGMIA